MKAGAIVGELQAKVGIEKKGTQSRITKAKEGSKADGPNRQGPPRRPVISEKDIETTKEGGREYRREGIVGVCETSSYGGFAQE